jgi:hypothetical protein
MLIYLEHHAKGNDGGHDDGYQDGFFALLRDLKVEDLFHNRKACFKKVLKLTFRFSQG